MMILAGCLALVLEEARDAFNLLLQIGAGTGLLFIMRWFWYRINPFSEITAMGVSFVIAFFFFINSKLDVPLVELASHWQLVFGVVVTTIAWIAVSLLTQPTKAETLKTYEDTVFKDESKFHNFGYKIASFFAGILGVYNLLFTTGYFIYGEMAYALVSLSVATICGGIIYMFWKKVV